MKRHRGQRILFFAGIWLAAVTIVRAEGVGNVDVTISDGAGRLTYRGKTDANGVFVSTQVAPGSYVVQFNAKTAKTNRSDYAIYAAAGHQRVVAEAIAGAKLSGAGVAMRLKNASGTPIIGQIVAGGVNALGTRIVNGRRYVLAPPQTGDVAPRWVEEGTTSVRNVTRISVEDGSMIKANAIGAAH
jgi:hypothetical protein